MSKAANNTPKKTGSITPSSLEGVRASESRASTPGDEPGSATQEVFEKEFDVQYLVMENRETLRDIQRRLKRIERLQFVKFLITILLVVAPIIGALIVLPRTFNTLLSAYGVSDQTVEGTGGVMEVFNQIQGLQDGLDQINNTQ